LNWGAAVLLFPAPSWNFPAETSIVHAPAAAGVKVAVYVVPEPLKKLSDPPLIVISVEVKSVVDSLDVKSRAIHKSLLVSPEFTVVDVIVIVGAMLS
jgi:hypothetical protein